MELMTEVAHVLLEDPDLAEGLHGERLEHAVQDCVVHILRFEAGEWSPPALTPEVRSGLGLLLLDGLVVRRVGVAGRVGSELLGEGDVLRPWEGEGGELMRAQKGRWGALRRGRLAVLDRDFSQRVCYYPEVISALFGRAIRRSRWMAVTMAILH